MTVACTFSGKFGDILWALPTVREISIRHGKKVLFYIMPQYESLLPLLNQQSYIEQAAVLPNWICTGSPHGDQPWEAPLNAADFEKVYHLTYKGHPGITAPAMPVVDFIAWQQGLELTKPVVPFIETAPEEILFPRRIVPVAYAFNDSYKDLKTEFLKHLVVYDEAGDLEVEVGCRPRNVGGYGLTTHTWEKAALIAKYAWAYVGDRSANWVIANGVGTQKIITYEPDPSRHKDGTYGKIFGNPYKEETAVPRTLSPEQATKWVLDELGRF